VKTIVSITPVRVEADSRTFKQAVSVARFGYLSIVVEGEESSFERSSLPFSLLSLAKRNLKPVGDPAVEVRSEAARPWKAWAFLGELRRSLKASAAAPVLLFLLYCAHYVYRYCWLPLRRTPPASLYILHGPHYFPAVYLLCKRHRAEYIYDAHDFYSGITPTHEVTRTFDRWALRFQRWLESLCIRNAAAVMTVSDGIGRLQRDAFGCSSVTVRNCHDLRLDQEPELSLRKAVGLSRDEFLLITVGQAKDGQVIGGALRALCALPSFVHLAFLGMGYERYEDEIRSLGLTKRLHMVQPVKPFEVVPFIRSADASLMLYYPKSVNYVNCLPNGFFQSIAAELPILYPTLPEIQSLADRFQLGLPIDPHDATSIQTAVQALLNPETAQEFRRNARLAKVSLSWEQEEKTLHGLVCSILR
jgi:glycosyltransferase involved in cell wall biosynthesis